MQRTTHDEIARGPAADNLRKRARQPTGLRGVACAAAGMGYRVGLNVSFFRDIHSESRCTDRRVACRLLAAQTGWSLRQGVWRGAADVKWTRPPSALRGKDGSGCRVPAVVHATCAGPAARRMCKSSSGRLWVCAVAPAVVQR